MDEYIVPKCAALMERRCEFLLILDNAPSHAPRLACEHYKTVLRGTVEFQPLCSPDLSPNPFLVERDQNTARSAPANPHRIAGTFDPRVSRDTDRQPLDVRRGGCCLGPQAKGLRGRQRRFFRVARANHKWLPSDTSSLPLPTFTQWDTVVVAFEKDTHNDCIQGLCPPPVQDAFERALPPALKKTPCYSARRHHEVAPDAQHTVKEKQQAQTRHCHVSSKDEPVEELEEEAQPYRRETERTASRA